MYDDLVYDQSSMESRLGGVVCMHIRTLQSNVPDPNRRSNGVDIHHEQKLSNSPLKTVGVGLSRAVPHADFLEQQLQHLLLEVA